jgi:hypothetical protein
MKKKRRVKEEHWGEDGGEGSNKRKENENNSNEGKVKKFSWCLGSQEVNEGPTVFFIVSLKAQKLDF